MNCAFAIFATIASVITSVLSFSRFWLLQQTHHPYWKYPFHPSHGLPIATSSISPARTWLPLVAARCRKRWRMATPRTGPCPAAKAQPQPHLHASHIAPEPTQLQCQLLCNGRGVAQCSGQSTAWHGWAGIRFDVVYYDANVLNLLNSCNPGIFYIHFHNL